MGLGYPVDRVCSGKSVYYLSMPKLRVFFPVMLLWVATLLAAYFWGAYRDGGIEKDSVTGARPLPAAGKPEPAFMSPEKIEVSAPVEPEVPEKVGAGRILAEAREKLRSGLFSQKGILRAFNSIQQLNAANVRDAVQELESLDARDPDHEVLLLAVMGRWAELDGNSAMKYAEGCLLYTSPSPRDGLLSRMPSSA